jgi:hypothetical protein
MSSESEEEFVNGITAAISEASNTEQTVKGSTSNPLSQQSGGETFFNIPLTRNTHERLDTGVTTDKHEAARCTKKNGVNKIPNNKEPDSSDHQSDKLISTTLKIVGTNQQC